MNQRRLSLQDLREHPKRDNVCPPDIQAKIQRHIERTGNYEPLVVYVDPDFPGQYVILNGHVRWEIAKALGWTKIECQIWEVTPADAEMILAALNTLRGTPDRQKRADLLFSLSQQFPVQDLALLLPESGDELEDLFKLQALNIAKEEAAFREQLEAEQKVLPLTLTFVVSVDGKTLIEAALALYQEADADRGEALVALCKAHLERSDHG